MKKNIKLLVIVPVLTIVLLTSGIVFADSSTSSNATDPHQDMTARVAQILGITPQKLTDAYKQAETELRNAQLKKLVQSGNITQAQADALIAWEAKRPSDPADKTAMDAWMKLKPDVKFPDPPNGPPPNSSSNLTSTK